MVSSGVLLLVLYAIFELVYFRVADKYNIIDKPNHRSSHQAVTIRGGGIIFPISFLLPLVVSVYKGWIFISFGLFAISLISFLDDIITLNNKVRLLIQSFSVALLLHEVTNFSHILLLLSLFIVITGIINAYNFMDGINGITALYSIVTIGTLFWLSHSFVTIIPDIFFISLLASLLVFSFFNIRKKAKCFAGDVGSVSMAFIICFLLLSLSAKTGSFVWILFLGVYGIDTVFTIICRLSRKEPIFKAHRSHFYQFLANEQKLNPLVISFGYALAQLILNMVVITAYQTDNLLIAIAGLFGFLTIYTIFRLRFEGRYRLFTAY